MSEMECGRCSACGCACERGPSGAWWHTDPADAYNCPARTDIYVKCVFVVSEVEVWGGWGEDWTL